MHAIPFQHDANLTGIDYEAVKSELEYFLKTGSWRPGVRMGLIFEGGALRGVVSAGYGLALSAYLNPNSLHAIYGSSSGALNAIYYASEHLETALKIYEENATDPMCTNIWNFPNVLNPDWLIDEWMFGKRKFDLEKIKALKPSLFITLTNLITGQPAYLDATAADPDTLRRAMKATSYSPLVSNGSQFINGMKCGDGAISDAIPYDKAIADGCTHLICLLTRPAAYRKSHTRLMWAVETLRLIHHTRDFRSAYFARDKTYSTLLERIYKLGSTENVPTMIIHPQSNAETPGNMETRSEVIREKGNLAFTKARQLLERVLGPASQPSRETAP